MPTISFDVTVAQATRIQKALGIYLNLKDVKDLPREATVPEVRQFLITHLKDFVLERELEAARKVVTTQSLDIV